MSNLPTPQQTPWQQSNDIDLAHAAVVVIDILGGSEDDIEPLREMAGNAVALVKAARAARIAVIFANDAHTPGTDRELELWGDHFLAGTEGAKPIDAFELQESDIIISKRRYNAFFQTDLDLTLRERGIEQLIVCGCDTNICVMHTLAGAYMLGYRTIVAADACASFLIGSHEDGLDYFTRCFDSRVVNTADLLERLG